jgi:protein TonB
LAPPPQPAPQRPVHLHAGIQAPRKITSVDPIYPQLARTAHAEGMVILEAIIDAQGRVESVKVLRSLPLLDQAAVDAVKQWTFTPAMLNGAAVPVVMTVTVNFQLSNR